MFINKLEITTLLKFLKKDIVLLSSLLDELFEEN